MTLLVEVAGDNWYCDAEHDEMAAQTRSVEYEGAVA